MKKQIFLVDADDTLLDFHGSASEALKKAFDGSGVPWQDEFASVYKTLNESLWQALERKELTRDELMNTRFHRLLDRLGLSEVSGDQFNEIYLKYLSAHPRYLDGAQEFLQKLNRMGAVYIVTNGTRWIQHSRFDIANLWQYAKAVFISEDVGADKPDKRYTDYVISKIEGYTAEKSIWIGDSLTADIQAASDAGIQSVWYNPHKKPLIGNVTPTYIVDNFAKILKILR